MDLTITQLKAARKILGMTQKELAKAIDVDVCTVGRWECGIGMCSGPAAILIARMVKEKKSKVEMVTA
jgi:transcriptional regulator with XRE-family HTH domain